MIYQALNRAFLVSINGVKAIGFPVKIAPNSLALSCLSVQFKPSTRLMVVKWNSRNKRSNRPSVAAKFQ